MRRSSGICTDVDAAKWMDRPVDDENRHDVAVGLRIGMEAGERRECVAIMEVHSVEQGVRDCVHFLKRAWICSHNRYIASGREYPVYQELVEERIE